MNEPYPYKDNEFLAWYPLGLTPDQAPKVWQRKRAGYYVHIPFCTAICDYCGFAVEKLKGASVERYLDALKSEIETYRDTSRLGNYRFVCGHFGGGTPSAIDAGELMTIKALIDGSFDVDESAEVTVEVNPISFTVEKALAYRRGGVNRISVGVQSFNDRTLAVIGRPHRAEDVGNTLNVIRNAGWTNYSLDIIYGVPGQTMDELREDLARAVDSGAAHLSSFRLEIIPMTALKFRESAHLLPPRLPVNMLNEMDDLVCETLTRNGFAAYGAFNFARPGFESVHNSVAFVAPQGEYVGFGNSSYSFINNYVYCNYAEVDAYEQAVSGGKDPIAFAAPVNALESMSRYFVLGLKFFRVSRSQFIAEFGIEPEQTFGDVLERLRDKGLVALDGDDYVLSRDGRRYVNNVGKEFFVGSSRGKPQYHQFVANVTVEQITRYAELKARAEEGVTG